MKLTLTSCEQSNLESVLLQILVLVATSHMHHLTTVVDKGSGQTDNVFGLVGPKRMPPRYCKASDADSQKAKGLNFPHLFSKLCGDTSIYHSSSNTPESVSFALDTFHSSEMA